MVPPKKEERKKSKGRKGKSSLEEENTLDNKFEESRDQMHFGGKFEESALDIPKNKSPGQSDYLSLPKDPDVKRKDSV